jgi:hypothetical protein
MDACELKIAKEWTKCLEKENVDLDAKLHSQVDDLKESTKTIEHL